MAPPDIIMLLCDTARADAFRPWGAPHPSPTVEALCREGRAFARAIAPAPWTLASVASIFSGRLPTEHGITGDCFEWTDGRPSSPSEAVREWGGPWLPEGLRERGYRTWGASCNSWISVWGGFDRGFHGFLDLRDPARLPGGGLGTIARRTRRMYGKLDRGGREASDEFGRWLSEGGDQPRFAFVDLMETHAPYDPPRPFYPYPPWRRSQTRRLSGGSGKTHRFGLEYNVRLTDPGPEYVATIKNLYFRCARYEDWLLGRFLAAVREGGRPSVVLVLADHGENLGEHGMFNHNSSLHETLLHVPLVVWGQKVDVGPGEVEDPVSLLGIRDWIERVAEGDGRPMGADGAVISEYESTVIHSGLPADLRSRVADATTVPALVFHPGLAIRRGNMKLISVESGEHHLYDLDEDPGETRDLLAEDPGAGDPFLPLVEGWRKRRANLPRYGVGQVAEGEIEEHLRALGYID